MKKFGLVVAVLALVVVFGSSFAFAGGGDDSAKATVEDVQAYSGVKIDDHTMVIATPETLQLNLYPPNYGPMTFLQSRMVDVTEWMGSFPIDAYYPMMLQKNNIPAQKMYGVVKTISGNVLNKINLKELYPIVLKNCYQAIDDFGVGNTALRIFWIPKNWAVNGGVGAGNAYAPQSNDVASGSTGFGTGASGPADYFIVSIVLKTNPADIDNSVHQRNAYKITAKLGGPSAPEPEKKAAPAPEPKPAAAKERDCSLYGKHQGLCD